MGDAPFLQVDRMQAKQHLSPVLLTRNVQFWAYLVLASNKNSLSVGQSGTWLPNRLHNYSAIKAAHDHLHLIATFTSMSTSISQHIHTHIHTQVPMQYRKSSAVQSLRPTCRMRCVVMSRTPLLLTKAVAICLPDPHLSSSNAILA